MAEVPQRFALTDDLHVVVVPLDDLREQDVNAQMMEPRHFDRLTQNIQDRGMVESLPYCHQPDGAGPISIVSGHHRARAARAAGLTAIPVIVDTRAMRRSEILAKQIAHNELHGSPDEAILRQMVAMIDNVDDLLTTGLPEDFLPTVGADDTSLDLPHAEFDWRMITLLFLPGDLADFTAALDMIDKHSEMVGLAARADFEAFAQAAIKYGRLTNIRNVATAVAAIIETARREIAEMERDGVQEASYWVRTASLVGAQMPQDAALVVREAVDKAIANGDCTPENQWLMLERWAADYLAGQ